MSNALAEIKSAKIEVYMRIVHSRIPRTHHKIIYFLEFVSMVEGN